MEHFQELRNNQQTQEIHHPHHWQSHRSAIASIATRTNSVMLKRRMNQNIDPMNQQQDDIVHMIVVD